jgi:hypothetical protein
VKHYYRIGDLNTGKGYEAHASSSRVALNYVLRAHMDEFCHTGDYANDQVLNLIVTDLGEANRVIARMEDAR